MRRIFVAAAAALALSGAASAQTVPTAAEVTKIDAKAGKITLRHEPIKNLDMERMTMVFRVASPDMLKSIKVGDKVVFEADRVNGALTVVSIRKSD
jgi:Cu/Ag efflux protein CusF